MASASSARSSLPSIEMSPSLRIFQGYRWLAEMWQRLLIAVSKDWQDHIRVRRSFFEVTKVCDGEESGILTSPSRHHFCKNCDRGNPNEAIRPLVAKR